MNYFYSFSLSDPAETCRTCKVQDNEFILFSSKDPCRGSQSPFRPYIENGPVAVSATRREQIVIIRLAVGMTLPLEEVARAELLVAVGAREVFRMPRFTQSSYHLRQGHALSG